MAPRPSPDERLPGVSVVIPAYNYARFLPAAIESALRQSHPAGEIIVVDDGSTDNTAEIVADFVQSSQAVRYIYQKNSGLPAARNTGIRQARFDYVGFLDADDEWLPGLLNRAMETFAALPAEFAIVACRSIFIDASGATLNLKRLAPEQAQEIRCRDIIFRTHFSPSSVVARKSAFTECGSFDEALRSSEDRDMWLRIAARRRVRLLAERLVRVRRHANNMSKHADRMKENMRRVIGKAYRNRLVSHNDFVFWLRVLSFFYFQTAWTYRDQGRCATAARDMICSVVLWPWFAGPKRFNEPRLFRFRSLIRFCREALAGPAPREPDMLLPAAGTPVGPCLKD